MKSNINSKTHKRSVLEKQHSQQINQMRQINQKSGFHSLRQQFIDNNMVNHNKFHSISENNSTALAEKKKHKSCLDIQTLFKRITKACYRGSSDHCQKQKKTQPSSDGVNQENTEALEKPMKPFLLPRQSKISQKQILQKSIQDKQIKSGKYPTIGTYKQIEHVTVGDKINYHLDILDFLRAFMESIKFHNEDQNPWRDLSSLIFRKYFCERKKLQKFFKKYPMPSPFKLKNGTVTTSQMISFMKLSTGQIKLQKIRQENQQFFQQISPNISSLSSTQGSSFKSTVNQNKLLSPIIKCIWQYILVSKTNKQITQNLQNYRICRAMQVGFIIADLQDIKPKIEAEVAEAYIQNQDYKSYVDEHFNLFQTLVLL